MTDKVKMYRCIKCGLLTSSKAMAHAHYIENGIDLTTVEMPRYTEGHFYEEIFVTPDTAIIDLKLEPWYSHHD